MRACEQCDKSFSAKRSGQRYCSPACGYAAKRKPRAAFPPPPRPCASCSAEYQPRAANQLYCSTRCVERAKYLRVRSNPDKWAAYLAKERAKYVPAAPRPERKCDVDDCGRKHFALGLCRNHYYKQRRDEGRDGGSKVEVLRAQCHRWAATAPKVKAVRYRMAAGLLPDCPQCDTLMRPLTGDHFLCCGCWTEVRFNPEEVSWLVSKNRASDPPLKAVSTPTPNSSVTLTMR